MGLSILLLGLALFIGTHAFVTRREAREALIARIGEGPYKLVFSLASAVGIAAMVYGFGLYRSAGWVELWNPPHWMRHVTALLMWPAVVLIVAAYLPGHIKARAQHPMLAGVKLWAFAHLLANGDLGSAVLFGGLLAWAVFDRISLKRRAAAPVPTPAGWRNDLIAVGVGTIAYLALGLAFHPVAIGVPAFGA